MNRRRVLKILGKILMTEAMLMVPSLIVSLIYGDGDAMYFVGTIAFAAIAGFILSCVKAPERKMGSRDGYCIVALAWIIICIIGAVPLFLTGQFRSYWSALFEIVSGFTTTGASVLSNPEYLPHGVLFWRSFTHWVGGMGVLVFVLMIMPMENENSKKKTTAPDTSVGADDGQPLHNSTENSISAFEEEINGDFQNSSESLDEIYRRMQRLTDPHYLHTISMTELYQTAYQSRPPIIDGLLYAGAYILAGAPKIGKSFLVAQIAYHVSTGKALWSYEIHPGTVLYLALEDDFQRIQSRMFMMYGVNDTDRLHFATAAGKIGNGLDEQLENFMREHPDTRLIIIDTMQKIREVGGEAYSYASDYEIIGKLKQFADKHCICVLTVHHTRKQPAGDSFEMISGTTGLLGCADGSLLMQKKKRTALEATIDVVGRDQQDQILYLKKDADTQIWNLEKVENELHKEPPDHVLDAVAGLLSAEHPIWTGSPSALADAVHVGMAANALSKYLNVKSGRLLDEYHVRYENKVRHEGRRITLTYDAESK